MNLGALVEKLDAEAINRGATSTKLVSTSDVVIAGWVKLKCHYGCGLYGKLFTCPPYAPTPDETSSVLQEYTNGLLVEFNVLKDEAERKIHRVMFDLERLSFLEGWYKAFAYTAGPCKLCPACPAATIQTPTEFNRKECKNRMERPSLEACGIDVYQTVRNAGYHIDVIRNKGECFKNFGLLLLE